MKKSDYFGFTKSKQDIAVKEFEPGIANDVMRIFVENSEELNDQ